MCRVHRSVSSRAIRVLATLGLIGLAAPSCTLGRPEPVISSLVVRNRGFMDVNVYVLRSLGADQARLGTVVGASTATFPIHSHDLQPGGFLMVRIHPIGGTRWWTSPTVSVGDGLTAVLDVNTDAFGDCSRSSLYTILTTDSVETNRPPLVPQP
ncbi:MAG TPA: hypothetical protein VF785_12720 [Gemmatimonadaceae bacterium]